MSSSAARPDALEGVFVTGTGTEVGKSVVAAVLARAAAARGLSVAVFKPAVSGLDDYADGQALPDHELLRLAAGSAQGDDEVAPYRYGPPFSPHLAAALQGAPIDPGRLLEGAHAAGAAADYLVCEGVGGFLVPFTLGYLVRDLAIDLALPVVIAASPGLGTINHTLLTVEAVRAAGLDLAAVVLTPWPQEPGEMERSNREAIERLGRVRVVELPEVALDDPSAWPDLRV